MPITITDILVRDIRFPTSRSLDGSDAMNIDPNYSAAYVVLKTDDPARLEGHGLTFTIGRGNELCVAAVNALKPLVVGLTLEPATDMGPFWKRLTSDSQLRWVGPEKGVVHLATAALVNAMWDLYAKLEGKPLWKLLVDMTPEQIVSCVPFSYITDAITRDEALEILRRNAATKQHREQQMREHGYPAYTWTHFKLKVGRNLKDDMRRARIIREEIGWERTLMMDANQVWDVSEAIRCMGALAEFRPHWIEEPTSPDDVLGHATIARAIAPIGVATGEHCQNRVMFKQLLQAGAISFCQIDGCRLGGVNEVLAVLLMAAKFDVPVCPHAGGVGLCEYVQHLSIFDYIAVSGSLENRIVEYVDHLHEHFVNPVVTKGDRYMLPWAPGFSIEMKSASLERYQFPCGEAWQSNGNEPKQE